MASDFKHRRHAFPLSITGAPVLPHDALSEVLLRLPAKDHCRPRVVCRSWRALTYDPHFAAEHKSRHAEPLFAFATDRNGGGDRGVAVVGLSGQVLRRIHCRSDGVDSLLLDRLCVVWMCKPSSVASLLSPAAAGALALPGPRSDEFVGACIEERSDWGSFLTPNCSNTANAYAVGPASTGDYKVLRIGHVASTGDYKVLRISHPDRLQPEQCDIITLDGGSSQQGRWRRKQSPPSDLMRNQTIEWSAVNGVVHFFFDHGLKEPASIAPFDLDAERWMPTLRGPEPLRSAKFGLIFGRALSLANLNGSLVIVDNIVGVSFDLWFLVDHKRGLWVKKYRISVKQICHHVRPLLILDDGRIVIFEMMERLLQCYDPTTGNLVHVLDIGAMGLAESIGVYTRSLLI